jgi:hypothetical protein
VITENVDNSQNGSHPEHLLCEKHITNL